MLHILYFSNCTYQNRYAVDSDSDPEDDNYDDDVNLPDTYEPTGNQISLNICHPMERYMFSTQVIRALVAHYITFCLMILSFTNVFL